MDCKLCNNVAVAFLVGVRKPFLLKALCLWVCPFWATCGRTSEDTERWGWGQPGGLGRAYLDPGFIELVPSSEKLKLETVMKSLMTGTNLSFGSHTWRF